MTIHIALNTMIKTLSLNRNKSSYCIQKWYDEAEPSDISYMILSHQFEVQHMFLCMNSNILWCCTRPWHFLHFPISNCGVGLSLSFALNMLLGYVEMCNPLWPGIGSVPESATGILCGKICVAWYVIWNDSATVYLLLNSRLRCVKRVSVTLS